MLLLDTHVWIWSVEGDTRRLGRRSRVLLAREHTGDSIHLSPASVFEVVALHTAGRIRLRTGIDQWVREALERTGLRLASMSLPIAIDAGIIPRSAVPDPLDRLLIATARDLDAVLLTSDRGILAYASETRRVRVYDASR